MSNTYESVWKTLSSIDISEHIERKMNLSYLSWAWAWGTLMKHYPSANYKFNSWDRDGKEYDVMYYPDGSASVQCLITIGDLHRTMWLPVMDNRNKSISNPSSRDISDTKMRCLVKCMAMFGLGHYIYAGEDLPQQKPKGLSIQHQEQLAKERAKANGSMS